MQLLAAYEVDTVFGMAGTMTLELYRGLARAGIRHVQCRNEQGASFMADGYARATGRPGVCTIIGGPGVTNAATGIAQAYSDSQPMLVLSGASPAPTHGKGWGAIHELNDQAAVTAGFTAFSSMVRYPEELPEAIARRDRVEAPPRSFLADARSRGDRGSRRAPRTGEESAHLRGWRRGRYAHA